MTPPRSLATTTHPRHRRHRFGPRRRAGTQQAVPANGQLADRHLRSGNDGTGHRNGDQCPADRGSGLGRHGGASGRRGAASRVCRVRRPPRRSSCPRRSLPPPRRHHHLRAIATARLKVPPAPPPPRVVVRNAAPAPAAPPPAPAASAARCASAGIPPLDHPVAATDSSATPFFNPGPRGRGLATAGHGGHGGHGGGHGHGGGD